MSGEHNYVFDNSMATCCLEWLLNELTAQLAWTAIGYVHGRSSE